MHGKYDIQMLHCSLKELRAHNLLHVLENTYGRRGQVLHFYEVSILIFLAMWQLQE